MASAGTIQKDPLSILGTNPYSYMLNPAIKAGLEVNEQVLKDYTKTPRLKGKDVMIAPHRLRYERAKIEGSTLYDPEALTTLINEDRATEYKQAQRALGQVADFYTLNYLWFWCGAGQEAYGYKVTDEAVKIPGGIRNRIDLEFKACAYGLAYDMADAMDRSVRGELRHAMHPESPLGEELGSGYAMKDESYEAWTKCFNTETEADEFNPFTYDMRKASTLFRHRGWCEDFGGEPWAKAADALINLTDLLRADTTALPKLVVQLDQILDMQHNTGVLLSKTEFCGVTQEFLTRRAQCKDVGKLVPLCSDNVQKLVKGVNRHFGLQIPGTDTSNHVQVYCCNEGSNIARAYIESKDLESAVKKLGVELSKVGDMQLMTDLDQKTFGKAADEKQVSIGILPHGMLEEAESYQKIETVLSNWAGAKTCTDFTADSAMLKEALLPEGRAQARLEINLGDIRPQNDKIFLLLNINLGPNLVNTGVETAFKAFGKTKQLER
jgi:hypothetical protein